MRLVRLDLVDGTLLLGLPSHIPYELHDVASTCSRASVIAKFWRDPAAVAKLRAQWSDLFPGEQPGRRTDHELQIALEQAVASGRLRAVRLREKPMRTLPVPPEPRHGIAHLNLGKNKLLIARKGALPGTLRMQGDAQAALKHLRAPMLPRGNVGELSRQAHQISDGMEGVRAEHLPQRVAMQVAAGQLDAVVVGGPHVNQQIGLLPGAPQPVKAMSLIEKVRTALRLSIRHLPAEFASAAMVAIIMEFGLYIGGLIAVQFVPGGAEAVDAAIAAVVYRIAGWAGLLALYQLFHATWQAAEAETDEQLDEAGREYASAFAALGFAKLAELRSSLFKGRPGVAEEVKPTESIGMKSAQLPSRPPESPAKLSTNTESPAQLPRTAKQRLEAIQKAKKGNKPPPSEYLSKEYIADHLAEFQGQPVYKVIKGPPREGAFGGDDVFVLPKSEIDNALEKSGGDPRKLEKLLGMDEGYLGDSPYLLKLNNPKNVRMATGNEQNAWENLWRPGGYTDGGVKEAVIDGKINRADFDVIRIGQGGS